MERRQNTKNSALWGGGRCRGEETDGGWGQVEEGKERREMELWEGQRGGGLGTRDRDTDMLAKRGRGSRQQEPPGWPFLLLHQAKHPWCPVAAQ
jgi:hypothetical protein